MTDYRYPRDEPSFTLDSVLRFMRVVGAGLGMLTIIIGLVFATRVFTLVYGALQDPGGVSHHVDTWADAVGGEQSEFVVEGVTVPVANILALLTLGGAVIVLSGLSLGLIKAGAVTLHKTLTDRDAVKQLLESTLGPNRHPAANPAPGPPPTPQLGSSSHYEN